MKTCKAYGFACFLLIFKIQAKKSVIENMKFKTDEQKEFNARMSLTIKILKEGFSVQN